PSTASCGHALCLAARQAQAFAPVGKAPGRDAMVRARARAALVQGRGRRLGQRRRSCALCESTRSLAEGGANSARSVAVICPALISAGVRSQLPSPLSLRERAAAAVPHNVKGRSPKPSPI